MSTLKRFRIIMTIMTENGISPRLDDAGDWVRHSDIADMYEALLKARIAVLTWHPSPDEPLADIDAALAKAEGRDDD